MSKYGNIQTIVDGRRFDSLAESQRYLQLRQMQADGVISNLSFQPTFELQPGFVDATGKRHRPIAYRADFRYIEEGKVIIEDVKGRRTQQYVLRMKMLLYHFRDIEFREIAA